MTLLLLFARDFFGEVASPATELVAIPQNFLNFNIDSSPPMAGKFGGHKFGVGGTLVNAYVRFIVGFEITWSLGNQAVLKCQTVDPFEEDPANSYRSDTGDEAVVSTKDGLVLFKGNIVEARERALGEPNSYTVIEINAVDKSEPLAHRFLTSSHGGSKNPVAIAIPGNPTLVQTRDPHELVTGDTVLIRDVVYIAGGVATQHPINGQRVVTVVNANQFTVPVNSSAVASGAGGEVSKMVRLIDVLHELESTLNEHGITLDPAIEDGPWIERVSFAEKSVIDILRYISSVTGWPFRILPEGVLQMFSAGSLVADYTMDAAAVTAGLQIQKQRTGTANTIIVKYGSQMVVNKREQIVGDGVSRVFPLKYTPASGASTVSPGALYDYRPPINGGYTHVGVWGFDTLFEWTYRASDNALVQLENWAGVVGQPPLPAGQVVETDFPIQFPQTVRVPDDLGGDAPREVVWQAPEVFDVNEAKQVGLGKLAELNDEPRRATVPTDAGLVWPGAVFNVDLPHRGMTGQWLVSEVRLTERGDGALNYEYGLLEGTQTAPGWRERIRSLFGGKGSGGSTGGTISGGAPGAPVPSLPPGGTGLSGAGTAGRIALWTDTLALGDSPVFLNGAGAVEVETDIVGQGNIIATAAVWTPTINAEADLTLAPINDVMLDPGSTFVLPQDPYTVNLGTLQQKFLTLHAAELWVETLVAQDTLATIGGRVLVAPTTHLVADITSLDTSIHVKHNNLAVNDVVYMESSGRVEFMRITGGPTGAAGDWIYTVARNLDLSGANVWYAGDAMVNTGQVGNGFIDLYSTRGAKSSTEVGPTIVGNVRTGVGYADWSPRWAIGNLRGLYSFGINTYGAAFGDPNGAWIVIEPTYGIRIGHGGGGANPPKVWIDSSGNASFAGTVTSSAGLIAGWSLIPQYIYSGDTSVARVGIKSSNIPTDVAFYAGNFTETLAPFRVLHNGALFASNATITGSITATSGNITAALVAGSITADKLAVSSLSAITANLGTVTAGAITGLSITGGTISGTTISGSTLQAGGGGSDVTINSSGLTITSGTGSSQKIKWTNGVEIFGSGSALNLTGGDVVSIKAGTPQLQWNSDGTLTYNSTGSVGHPSVPWGTVYTNNLRLALDNQNAGIGYPIVQSSDGFCHKATNGINGNYSGGTFSFENGICTGHS